MELIEYFSELIKSHGLIGFIVISLTALIIKISITLINNGRIKFKTKSFTFEFPRSNSGSNSDIEI